MARHGGHAELRSSLVFWGQSQDHMGYRAKRSASIDTGARRFAWTKTPLTFRTELTCSLWACWAQSPFGWSSNSSLEGASRIFDRINRILRICFPDVIARFKRTRGSVLWGGKQTGLFYPLKRRPTGPEDGVSGPPAEGGSFEPSCLSCSSCPWFLLSLRSLSL